MPADRYLKRASGAPAGAPAWEAAGLRWLAAVQDDGGARVVEVLDVTDTALTLERLSHAAPTPQHLEDFGRALARTHGAGATAFGVGPPDWHGDGYLGPASELLPLPLDPTDRWGEFYGEQRVRHTLRMAQERGIWQGSTVFDAVADRLTNGDFDDDDPVPARLHGDLWSGNVVWTATGGVLIDPAAHGGQRLTDLAMLLLFGGGREERVVDAYQEANPLPMGWRDLVGLHQLHPVMLHAVLFGGGYLAHAESLAQRYG